MCVLGGLGTTRQGFYLELLELKAAAVLTAALKYSGD